MARKTITGEWAATASASEIVEPIITKQNAGWTAEKPPYQNFNWAWQIFTNMLQNAEQFGIMQWSTDTTYPQYGLSLGSDGSVYQSQLSSNQGNDPTTDDGANWISYNSALKPDTEYLALTSGSSDLTESNTSSTFAYNIADFVGPGIVPANIRGLYVRFFSNFKGSFSHTYTDPAGVTRTHRNDMGAFSSDGNYVAMDEIVLIPINKSQASISISCSAANATLGFEIIAVSQCF